MSFWKTRCTSVVRWCGLILSAATEQHQPLSALPERSGGTDGFQLSAFHICHANLSGVTGKEVGFQAGIREEVPDYMYKWVVPCCQSTLNCSG